MSRGVCQVRVHKRARILLLLDRGATPPQGSKAVGVVAQTVINVGRKYINSGLQGALYDSPRPGRKPILNKHQSQQVVAMVCSDPPLGRSRWTVKLILEEVLKRRIAPRLGRETVRMLLKTHELKPWRQKMWCIPELNREYIERMEEVLNIYEQPYCSKDPVVCLDEKPIQLHSSTRAPIPVSRPGQIAKKDYEYKRCGTANVFIAVEPKSGTHLAVATKNRKGKEFAKFIHRVARKYPRSRKIHLVMDNLNTHKEKSLVDYYGKRKGKAIWRRFSIHYTPKHASWLNQAEIDIGIYSSQCLGRNRICSLDALRERTNAWKVRANKDKMKIDWKFTTKKARRKFDYKKPKN